MGPVTMATVARAMPLGLAAYAGRGRWRPAPHLELINKRLLDVAAGKVRSLMVSAPPRHGKSELVSHYYPAWYLGNWPERNVILASYESSFAWVWGRKARDTLAYHGPSLWGVGVQEDYRAAGAWATTRGGVMFSTGVDGPATGRGADVLIIDDPVKNQKEARSKAIQDRNWDWYRSVAQTRLTPKGAKVLVMTRWGEHDLAGRILADDEEDWVVVRLPALAEAGDILGRAPGEALWPEKYDAATLHQKQASLGPSWFNALYQGRPGPEEGTLFKRLWFQYWRRDGAHYVLGAGTRERRVEADGCETVTFADMAATEGEQSSYTAMLTCAVTPDGDLLVLDLVREKAETTRHRSLVDGVFARHPGTRLGIERKTYGLALIQDLQNTGIPIFPLEADRDKVARARFAEARYALGKVYHPVGAPWLGDLEDELLAFPNGEYDDIVDTVGYAAMYVAAAPRARVYRGSRRRF